MMQKREIALAIKEVQESHKHSVFSEFLVEIREFSNELIAIANKTSKGKYRGGLGNQLKNNIELFLGNLKEEKTLFTQNQNELIYQISTLVKAINFDDIESNIEGVRMIIDNFEGLRTQMSTYISPHKK